MGVGASRSLLVSGELVSKMLRFLHKELLMGVGASRSLLIDKKLVVM